MDILQKYEQEHPQDLRYAFIGFIALTIIISLLLISWDNDVSPIRSITTDDVLPR